MRLGIRRTVLTLAMSAGLLSTVGCPFFVCQKASCPATGTTTGTGDYVYVSNSTAGSTSVNAYIVGTNSLTAVTGSPFDLAVTPVAMAVSPNNDEFLYVAGQSSEGLYVYSINTTTGELSGGTELLSAGNEVDAMAISPDGGFLFTLGIVPLGSEEVLTEYSLTSSGTIGGTGGSSFSLPANASCALLTIGQLPETPTCSISVSSTEGYVAVALGLTGTAIFPYSSSTGIPEPSPGNAGYTGLITPASGAGDYSVALDSSGYLYVATTGGVSTYNSLATPNFVTSYSYPSTGTYLPARAVTLSTNDGYLFTADQGNNEVSGFTLSNGTLSPLTTPATGGPAGISALAVDRSGSYLFAAGYNQTNGFQMFSISSSGLNVEASQPTSTTTSIPVAIAHTY